MFMPVLLHVLYIDGYVNPTTYFQRTTYRGKYNYLEYASLNACIMLLLLSLLMRHEFCVRFVCV
jgi:hypothetical protein